jgi:hypothetical protein
MRCPTCGNKTCVEVNLHPEGFAQNLQECGCCGALWTMRGEEEILLIAGVIGASVS